MRPGWQELLIILVIIVIIFGGAKLAGVGKASGRAIREFKDELKGPESADELQDKPAPTELGGTLEASAPAPDEAPNATDLR
jgi:sec-independent protein translocase protein TatA